MDMTAVLERIDRLPPEDQDRLHRAAAEAWAANVRFEELMLEASMKFLTPA